MPKPKMPRWLYAALGFVVALTLVVGVPAIRAAAEDGDDPSPTPAATTTASTPEPEPTKSTAAPQPRPSQSDEPDPAPAEPSRSSSARPTATATAKPSKGPKAPRESVSSRPSSSATTATGPKKPGAPGTLKQCVNGREVITLDPATAVDTDKYRWWTSQDDDAFGDPIPDGFFVAVVELKPGVPTWSDGTSEPLQWAFPKAGKACPVEKTKVTAVNGTFTDKCGLDFNLEFTPAKTEGVKYVTARDGNTLKVSAVVTDEAKFELTNPTWTQSATDKLEACKLVGLGFKTGCGVVDVTNPAKNPGLVFQYGSFDELSPDGEVFIEPGQTVRVKTSRARLDWAAFDLWGDYEAIFGEGVKVPQKCGPTTKPPKKPTKPDKPWEPRRPGRVDTDNGLVKPRFDQTTLAGGGLLVAFGVVMLFAGRRRRTG